MLLVKVANKTVAQSGEQKLEYLEPIANMWHNYDILLAVNSARVLSLTYFHMQRNTTENDTIVDLAACGVKFANTT